MTTLLEIEQAEEGLEEYANSKPVQQWNAETERLRQIERLTECIVYQYEVNDLKLGPWLDVFCSSEDVSTEGTEKATNIIQGTARDLAVKIHSKGWHIEDFKTYWILCPVCQKGDSNA
jgi:hypothetical protein